MSVLFLEIENSLQFKYTLFEFYFCRYEKTHLSFLLEASMDRIVISKPGEPVPKLGDVIDEDPESVKRRKRIGTGSVEWNLENTYTMSFWSAYVSYLQVCLDLLWVMMFRNLTFLTCA